jgi:hypothetical protein
MLALGFLQQISLTVSLIIPCVVWHSVLSAMMCERLGNITGDPFLVGFFFSTVKWPLSLVQHQNGDLQPRTVRDKNNCHEYRYST